MFSFSSMDKKKQRKISQRSEQKLVSVLVQIVTPDPLVTVCLCDVRLKSAET